MDAVPSLPVRARSHVPTGGRSEHRGRERALFVAVLALLWWSALVPTATAQEDDSADLEISLLGFEERRVFIGQENLLIVVLRSDGPSDAMDTRVDIELPPDVTLSDDPEWVMCPPNDTIPNTLTCDRGTVAAGGGFQEELWLHVGPSTPVPVTLRATVRSSTPDPDESNNVVTSVSETIRFGSLSVVVDAPEVVAPGSDVHASLSITNDGRSDAFDLDVVLAPPPGLLDVTLTPDGQTATAMTSSVLDTLPVGETATFAITGTVAQDAAGTLTSTITARESAESGFGTSATWDLVAGAPTPSASPSASVPPADPDEAATPSSAPDGDEPTTAAPADDPADTEVLAGTGTAAEVAAPGVAGPVSEELPATGVGVTGSAWSAFALAAGGLLLVLQAQRRRRRD